MIQADEGSAIPANVFEVMEGALSEAGENNKVAKLMMMGNPNFTAGEFYSAFTKNSNLYSRFTLTGDPDLLVQLNIKQGEAHRDHGKVYHAPRVSKKYREVMARKYGLHSPVYDVRVRGVFPRTDDLAVVPLEWAEKATEVNLPVFDNISDPITLVLDVARFGGDETVLGSFRRGHCIDLESRAKTSTVQAADMVMDAIRKYRSMKIPLIAVIIDEPGVGGGVIDDLHRRECPVAIRPYNGGESMKSDVDDPEDVRMFANRRSRDWWHVRRLMELGLLSIPDDEETVNQLASVQYGYNEKEKILVESKKKMRDRLGDDASPDRADVIVMGCAPYNSTSTINNIVDANEIEEGNDRPTDDLGILHTEEDWRYPAA
jgi:hypothetical protein